MPYEIQKTMTRYQNTYKKVSTDRISFVRNTLRYEIDKSFFSSRREGIHHNI